MERNSTARGWKGAGSALLAAVAATAFFLIANSGLVPLPSIDLPAIPFPDLPELPVPDLPDWLGVAFKWGKFVAIAALLALALMGAIDDDRDRGKDGPDGGD
jgi:hypothetical protein